MRRRDDVVFRTAPGFVALCRVGGRAVTVEGTFVEAWDLLEASIDFDVLVAELSARFGTEPDIIRRDLVPLIDRLVRDGFIDADD